MGQGGVPRHLMGLELGHVGKMFTDLEQSKKGQGCEKM